MAEVTVQLPEDIWSEVQSLVVKGVYRSPEDAVVSLVRLGLSRQGGRERPGAPYPPPITPPPPPGRPPGGWPDHLE